jgi:hypothetical protein
MASFFDHHCGVRYPLPPLLSTLFSPTCLHPSRSAFLRNKRPFLVVAI